MNKGHSQDRILKKEKEKKKKTEKISRNCKTLSDQKDPPGTQSNEERRTQTRDKINKILRANWKPSIL